MTARTYRFGETARWGLLVTAAFVVIHGETLRVMYEPNTWLYRDNAFYYLTTVMLAEHGRLEQRAFQPESWYAKDSGWNRNLPDDWSDVALGRNGGWYPKHPIVLPVLAVPFYWLFGKIGTLIVNVLMNLGFVLLVFLLGRRIARTPLAAMAAIVLSAMPFVREMSYSFTNDLLSADLILGAMELALARWLGWAGVLAGISLWSRATNVALLPSLALLAWSAGGWRALVRAAAFSLIPIGLYGAFNTYLFGAPWITTYQTVLVRENGVMKTASHAHHFSQPLGRGLHKALFDGDGLLGAMPLLIPGLLGVLVIGWRRRLVSLGLLLACVLPELIYAKYDFNRPHFLYSAFGIAGVGIAGLLQALVPSRDTEQQTFWQVPARAVWVFGGLLLAGVLVWRATNRPDRSLLSVRVHDAEVWLDETHCDYWNIQNERWECSHVDNGGTYMTGRLLTPEPVHGRPRVGLWMQPSPTRRTKRMIFRDLDAKQVDLDLAMGDRSRPGPVNISILTRGQPPIEVHLVHPGEEEHRTVTIGAGEGPALELRVQSPQPDSKHVIVEGHLR